MAFAHLGAYYGIIIKSTNIQLDRIAIGHAKLIGIELAEEGAKLAPCAQGER